MRRGGGIILSRVIFMTGIPKDQLVDVAALDAAVGKVRAGLSSWAALLPGQSIMASIIGHGWSVRWSQLPTTPASLTKPDFLRLLYFQESFMIKDKSKLGPALLWGGITVVLYGLLFHYADQFQQLAHTTLNACAIGDHAHPTYYNKVTDKLCSAEGGNFVEGVWWYVFVPIALAFALSYTHGNFTSLFWNVLGLKAKK